MSLTDESFLAATGRQYSCIVSDTLKVLSRHDREVLERALATDKRRISNSAIARVMAGTDTPISLKSVARHRAGECQCQKT